MTGRRGKALSEEDRILWSLVARTATPLKGRIGLDEPPPETARAEPPKVSGPAPAPAMPQQPVGPKKLHVFHSLDAQTHEKLARGRMPIEGRVDLHGLTQDEAYSLLLSFLRRAHGSGVRYVLVITGKGSSSGGDGVLRRMVPAWLATPAFRPLVSGHDGASRNHGGGGALYVRLRNRKGAGL